MKIAYMMGSLNRGGAEVLMLDLFRNAKEAGLDIIGIHRRKGDLYDDFYDTGYPMVQLWPKHRFDLLYFIRLRKLLKKNKITLVHTQHPVDALLALIACCFLKIKITLTFHSFSMGKPWWYKYLLYFLFVNLDYCFFVSHAQMEHYRDKYYKRLGKKAKVVHNSIDLRKFKQQKKGSIREELGISENELLLGSIGNFNSARDQFTTCRALDLLKKGNIDFNFVFAGAQQAHEPELYDRCVNFCKGNKLEERVFFLGPRNDVPSLLSQFDAFVYSSKRDTFGIAVAEALVSGTPVIVNDWKVMLEVTAHGQYAQIYKSGDPGDLLHKLLMFVNEPQFYKRKAMEQQVAIRDQYDIHAYLQRLRSTYESIL